MQALPLLEGGGVDDVRRGEIGSCRSASPAGLWPGRRRLAPGIAHHGGLAGEFAGLDLSPAATTATWCRSTGTGPASSRPRWIRRCSGPSRRPAAWLPGASRTCQDRPRSATVGSDSLPSGIPAPIHRAITLYSVRPRLEPPAAAMRHLGNRLEQQQALVGSSREDPAASVLVDQGLVVEGRLKA